MQENVGNKICNEIFWTHALLIGTRILEETQWDISCSREVPNQDVTKVWDDGFQAYDHSHDH